jgi:hypothetical protein
MAKSVTAVVLGGQPKLLEDLTTVSEIAEALGLPTNHSVRINDTNGTYESELSDFDFVAFGSKVEGGLDK